MFYNLIVKDYCNMKKMKMALLGVLLLAGCNNTTSSLSSTPENSFSTSEIASEVTSSAEDSATSEDISIPDPVYLDYIVLDTTAVKTEFYYDETFTAEGLIVTAYFTDDSFSVVSDFGVSAPTFELGLRDVSVSYTFENITKVATYQIEIKDRLGPTDCIINSVFNKEVSNQVVYLNESEYIEFKALENYEDVLDVQVALNSYVTNVTYNAADRHLSWLVTDGVSSATYYVTINVREAFGASTFVSGYGSNDYITWSYLYDGYHINKTSSFGSATYYYADGKAIIGKSYEVSFNVSLDELEENAEFKVELLSETGYMIRFVCRVASDLSLTFLSDRYDGEFMNYLTHKAALDNKAMHWKIIVFNNVARWIVDNELIYERAVYESRESSFCISAGKLSATISQIDHLLDTNTVSANFNYYNEIANTLIPNFGKLTNGNGWNLDKVIYENNNYIINQDLSSSSRTAGALYTHGSQVYGSRFGVKGTVRIYDTKTTGGAASKVEFQVYMNASNYIKFYLYRYSTTNNSLYIEGMNSQLGKIPLTRIMNNTFEAGTDITLNYEVLFDLGNIYFVIDNELVHYYQSGWRKAGYAFGVLQYAKTTWSNTEIFDYNNTYDEAYLFKDQLNALRNRNNAFLSDDYFVNTSSDMYVKEDYTTGFSQVMIEGEPLANDYYVFGGRLINYQARAWGQAEITIYSDDYHSYRYVLEKTDRGEFQVFTEYKNVDGTNWLGRKNVIAPHSRNKNFMTFEVVVNADSVYLLINNLIYHSYVSENDFIPRYVQIGGRATYVAFCDGYYKYMEASEMSDYIATLKEYEYISPYTNRIDSLAAKYASATPGGTLFLGSSTIDFWSTWATDCALTDGVTGYNVGIGGTLVEDWFYAYDKLVKPFNASRFVIFVGGNNINANGDTAEYTANLLDQFILKIHQEFPDSEIYYIYSLPTPSNYANGVYTYEYGQLIVRMKEICATRDYVTGVDMEAALSQDGNPIPGYFLSDGIHMSEAGYAAWTKVVRKEIFKYLD
ncbi:MAG: hypothetical protein BWX74_00462 [Tenericutes bacterium ADurb.Bin087]|nr:MAG: hypothetical protein BWX74_00462 [Tenericutes bacterium ADurb.Bin087]